jgi:hypothetical protein
MTSARSFILAKVTCNSINDQVVGDVKTGAVILNFEHDLFADRFKMDGNPGSPGLFDDIVNPSWTIRNRFRRAYSNRLSGSVINIKSRIISGCFLRKSIR